MQPSKPWIDHLISLIVPWLDLTEGDPLPQGLITYTRDDWAFLPAVIFSQGVSPYLHSRYRETSLYATLPPELQQFLAREFEWNAKRIERMHSELKELLSESNRIGIPVMPLKGSLLSTLGYIEPAIRPMADIDLLIHPVDKAGFTDLLQKRGYQLQESENFYSKHDRFLRVGEEVVSWEGEHPDNPRPVEVHTEIRRRLWGDIGNFDISRWLWSGSTPGLVLGEPAFLPKIENLLLHIALHATENLLVGTGRLIQWLDLACLATKVPNLEVLPFCDHLFPSIALAKRVFPNQLAGLSLSNIASIVHPRLVRWVNRTPINSQCGLVYNLMPKKRTRLMKRWARWRPEPWRMAVGYGNIPLLKAYQLHFLAIARSLHRVGRIKLSRTAQPAYSVPEG